MGRFGRYGEGFWAGGKYLTATQLVELAEELKALGEKEGNIAIHIHCYDAAFDDKEVYYKIFLARNAISPENSAWSYRLVSDCLSDIAKLLMDKAQMIKGAGMALYYEKEEKMREQKMIKELTGRNFSGFSSLLEQLDKELYSRILKKLEKYPEEAAAFREGSMLVNIEFDEGGSRIYTGKNVQEIINADRPISEDSWEDWETESIKIYYNFFLS